MICFKYKFDVPLDSIERTLAHQKILASKPFLRKIYLEWYKWFIGYSRLYETEKILEIGSGGGFLEELLPNLITSDIQPIEGVGLCFSALEIPLENQSLDGIYMVNVFHHIADTEKFLAQAYRLLQLNGLIIMVEPANTIWSRFVYSKFHHENFDSKGGWGFSDAGALSSSNVALPWIVFIRDRHLFKIRFPGFEIESIHFHTSFVYILSGGFTFRNLVPGFLFGTLNLIDKILCRLSSQFAMFMTVKIRKVF